MKSNSNQQPPRIQDLGNGTSHFNFNVEKEEATEDTDVNYNYNQVVVDNPVNYSSIVAALVKLKYTVNDEIALLRQQATKPAEYQAYYDYVEECKVLAKDE